MTAIRLTRPRSARLGARMICALMLGTVALPVTTGCQTLRAIERGASTVTISYEQEAQLGATYSEQIEAETPMLNDAEAQAWVRDLGNRLLAASPTRPPFDFTFQVTADEAVNAFAIPGGYCYVNVGLIRAADNEAEVAAVMAHEIGHVTARHGARSIQRSIGLQVLLDLLVGGDSGALINAVQQVGGVAAMRQFGRDDEREADRLGVQTSYNAGFDPRYAASFFEKILAIEQEHGHEWGPITTMMSTHPPTPERIANIQAQVAELDMAVNLEADSERFQALRARLGAQ